MNQTKDTSSFSLKNYLITLFFSAVVFFLTHGLGAFLLKKVWHFETYYPYLPWLFLAVNAVVISLFSASAKRPYLQSMAVCGTFSLMLFASGLLISSDRFEWLLIVIRLVFFVAASLLFLFLMLSRKKKSMKKRKFRSHK